MDKAAVHLKNGKVGAMPTDTIYGLVASALDPKAVARTYEIKGRDESKPFIILVSAVRDLDLFHAALDDGIRGFLAKHWPAPLSVILPVPGWEFEYLHRGTKSLAFRMPDNEELLSLLASAGPVVAPSANPQGMPPARTVQEARDYFGEKLDFYIDGGELAGEPSTLVDARSGLIEVRRRGAYQL